MDWSTSGFPVHYQLPEFTQTHVHWVGNSIQPFHPLSTLSPPTFNLSKHQGIFQWVNSSHHVAKVLEFQLQHQSDFPGLISFRMDWLDLLAVQGTLKSLLQNHGSIASILQRPDSFIVQLSNLSHSVVFLYFFALIAEEGFLISPCYSLELCIQMGISFLFSFASLHSYTKFQMKRERAINNKYEAKSCISDQPIPQY